MNYFASDRCTYLHSYTVSQFTNLQQETVRLNTLEVTRGKC